MYKFCVGVLCECVCVRVCVYIACAKVKLIIVFPIHATTFFFIIFPLFLFLLFCYCCCLFIFKLLTFNYQLHAIMYLLTICRQATRFLAGQYLTLTIHSSLPYNYVQCAAFYKLSECVRVCVSVLCHSACHSTNLQQLFILYDATNMFLCCWLCVSVCVCAFV